MLFVLLCGITVNASIYILNEYNSVRKRFPRLSPLRAYVKAWNTKVIPIFLTVTSTILDLSFYGRHGKRRLLVSIGSRHYRRINNVCNRSVYFPASVYIEKEVFGET